MNLLIRALIVIILLPFIFPWLLITKFFEFMDENSYAMAEFMRDKFKYLVLWLNKKLPVGEKQ